LAHIHYKKFATGGYIVSPPNMVYVTTYMYRQTDGRHAISIPCIA